MRRVKPRVCFDISSIISGSARSHVQHVGDYLFAIEHLSLYQTTHSIVKIDSPWLARPMKFSRLGVQV